MPMKILILCFFLFFNLGGMAQDNTPDDLLNLKKYKQNQNTPYTGGAFVHIDLPTAHEQSDIFKPTPLQVSGTYPIKTPFGQKTEAAFVPHATDFNTIIQILSDGTVIMDQTIQFVNTKKSDYFIRSFKKQNGVNFLMIKATRNNAPVNTVKLSQTDTHWRIQDKTQLPSGIYSYTLSYLIKGAVQIKDNQAYLTLSLTGEEFSLPVERFSTILLFPKKANSTTSLTFGTNNVSLPQAFKTQTDDKGNISYHLTHPLPAYTDVKIHTAFDKNVLFLPTVWDRLLNAVNHLLFIFCLIVLGVYTVLTRLYLKYHKTDKLPLKDLRYYSCLSLRYMTNHPLSADFLHLLKTYNGISKHPIRIPKFIEHHPLGFKTKFFIFLNVMRKYIFTMIFIIALTVFQAQNTGFSLNSVQIGILLLATILFNVWLFKTGEKPYIKKNMTVLMQNLFQINIATGTSKAALKALFLRFYPYTAVMGKHAQWCQLMQEYNIDIHTFYQEGK